MSATIDELKKGKELYIQQQVDQIINDMKSRFVFSWSVATCDHFQWDRELHRMFPDIADELRKHGFTVTKSVNFGVTDWIIKL